MTTAELWGEGGFQSKAGAVWVCASSAELQNPAATAATSRTTEMSAG